MLKIGPSNENEIILAFLQAEIDSPRFKNYIENPISKLAIHGFDRGSLIDTPDLNNELHNSIRASLLNFRGYGDKTGLFQGWPKDIVYEHIEIEPREFGILKYMVYDKFLTITQGTRLVIDGVKNLDIIDVISDDGDNFNNHVNEIVTDMKKGKSYPEIIGIQAIDKNIILVEGHTRVTAHMVAHPDKNIKMILGTSPEVSKWYFY